MYCSYSQKENCKGNQLELATAESVEAEDMGIIGTHLATKYIYKISPSKLNVSVIYSHSATLVHKIMTNRDWHTPRAVLANHRACSLC